MWKDSQILNQPDIDINKLEIPVIEPKHSALEIFDSADCHSGYVLVYYPIFGIPYLIEGIIKNELEVGDITGFLTYFSFLSYALISFILLFFAFMKKKDRQFLWLSAINICIVIVSYFLFLYISYDKFCIKYGFYLLVINSLLIFYSNFSKKRNNS